MAKDKTLALTVKIAGRMDKSLVAALDQSQRQISGFSKMLSNIGTVGLAAMGAMTTAAVAGLKACVDEAVEYQNQMGDVIKYVDGLADANGKITDEIAKNANDEIINGKTYAENYDLVYDSIQRISTQVPLTREYLSEMTAAIGQSGKSIEQMFSFNEDGSIGGLVKDAAVMASAWDIEAKEAADYSAKWENSFNMSHEEVMELANQINYLGANSATTAAEIANAVNQSASLGKLAGIDPSTTAALADAMLATGVASDRVGTSIKRMALNLSKGSDMTEKQKGVLEEMGLSASWVSKSLTEDSVGTLQTLFEGIGRLPKERQLNAVGQLFGVWAAEGGAKIVNNLDVYQKALDMVADQSAYANSMQREFEIKTSTPEAIKQMRESAVDMFKVNIGKSFVPVQTKLDESIRDLFLKLNDNMPQFEELSGTLAELASKGIAKVGEVLEKALPYITKALDYVNDNGPQVVKTIGKMAAVFAGMKFAPAIERIFRGGSNLLSGLKGAPAAAGTMLFGTKLRSGGTRGGLLNSLMSSAASFKNGAGGYLGNIGASLANLGGTRIGSSIISGAKGLGGATAEILSGISEATGLTGLIGNVTGLAKSGAGLAAGKAAGLFGQIASSGAGQAISGALGGAGSFLGGAMGNIGSFLSAGGGVLSSVWGPIAGGFGGMLTGALPIVGGISTVIAAVSLLGDHLEDIRGIVQNVFGDAGVAIFDKFTGALQGVGDFLSGLFSEGGMTNALGGIKDAVTGMFGEDAGAAFGGVITILESVSGVIRQLVDFANGTVKPVIENIFGFITQTVMPKILEIFTAAAPEIASLFSAIGNAVMNAFTFIGNVIHTVGPIIGGVISTLLNIGQVVIPAVLAAAAALFDGISQIIGGIKTAFQGVIDFITGIFTANWSQAWEGVKNIFSGVFNALEGLLKTPLNAVISLINKAIEGINGLGLTIPDWVPVLGGKSFSINIPEIPLLAKGGFTNGPSIAGEAGQEAVISFQKSARRENVALWQQAGSMLGVKEREIADIGAPGGGGSESIVFSPQITITGNADRNEVQEGLRLAMDDFERMYNQMMRRKQRYGFATV